jgi:hypothetical protein
MTMMTATFSSFEAIGSKYRSRSMWRQFLASVINAPTPTAEDQINQYLACHSRDLPPQVFIELERRHFGP